MPDMPMDEMMGSDMMTEDEPEDEEDVELMTAFPGMDADRRMALKEAIRLCVQREMEGGYDKGKGEKSEGEGILALALGPPKKKS